MATIDERVERNRAIADAANTILSSSYQFGPGYQEIAEKVTRAQRTILNLEKGYTAVYGQKAGPEPVIRLEEASQHRISEVFRKAYVSRIELAALRDDARALEVADETSRGRQYDLERLMRAESRLVRIAGRGPLETDLAGLSEQIAVRLERGGQDPARASPYIQDTRNP